MKMKKAILVLLAAGMSMSILAGCGDEAGKINQNVSSAGATDNNKASNNADEQTVEKVNLKVWVPEEEMELTQKLCEAFDEAYPQFDCNFELAVVGIDESAAALQTDPEIAADVFKLPSGSISQLVDAGLLYPITAESETVKSLYGEGALEACTKNDLLYGIPTNPNTWFVFYNKSLFNEEDMKSLDIMMAKDLGEDTYNFSCQISNSWYLEAFFYAAGCTLYGQDGTDPKDCTWNNADGIKAANYVIELSKNPKYIEDQDGIAGSLMKEGKLGAFCTGSWSAPDMIEALGDDFGAAPLPTINLDGKECQMSNFADYVCFGVKSNTEHPLAAQLFAEWLNNEESQLARYQEVKATPTVLALQNNEEIANDTATCALIAQTEFSTPQPSISQINHYWAPVQALGEGIINGDITSANIQEKLDSVVNEVTSSLTE